MLELWIPITIAAAGIQSVRTALQKHLLGSLPNAFVNLARYAFGAPIAVGVFLAWVWLAAADVPNVTLTLIFWCTIIALTQILGTWGLIAAFATRNLAVAVTFSKTEALQTALLSTLILGEQLALVGWLAILLSVLGIVVLTIPPSGTTRFSSPTALKGAAYGLFAGAMFGLSATAIRTASIGLGDHDFLTKSLLVLAITTSLQLVLLGGLLVWKDRAGFGPFFQCWRMNLAIGVASVSASAGWFTAMTLQKSAYVQALGQIELVFSIIVTRLAFRDPLTRWEVGGIALFIIGIGIVLLSRT